MHVNTCFVNTIVIVTMMMIISGPVGFADTGVGQVHTQGHWHAGQHHQYYHQHFRHHHQYPYHDDDEG